MAEWNYRSIGVSVLIAVLTTNCAVRGRVDVKAIPLSEPVRVTTPVKAHLADGSTVVYAEGVSVEGGMLVGTGTRFDLALAQTGRVTKVPLDQVVALESFENTTNREMTVLASGGATLALILGGAALAVAIFGSCPTVYGEDELEAELFSYSIAPFFELYDVDRLRTPAGDDGLLQLTIRNEALETHYLNLLEVIEVRHAVDELVIPDPDGRPLALSGLSSPESVIDRRGRDIAVLIAAEDDKVFRADAETLAQVSRDDFRDFIDLRVPVAPGQSEIGLVLRLRNSLLNTVLFYDTMLKAPGARSLDWLGKELGEIRPAFELATWYSSTMGMRVEVWKDGRYEQIARVADTGPIAWNDVAVLIPVDHSDGEARVRLSFVTDNWRIDHVQVAQSVRRPETRTVPLFSVTSSEGARDDDAARSLQSADNRYLQTYPGQSFRVEFAAGSVEGPRTFLLRSRGYYTEWIRGAWASSSEQKTTFRPGDDALLEAMMRWRDVQADFEARFDATRIPTR